MRLLPYASLLAAIASASAATIAAAAAVPALEDLDLLDARIAALAGVNAAHPIDRRLRLIACREDAVIDRPARGAVTVACASRGWRLRVPLLGVTAAEPAEIVIRRGDAVQLAYIGAGFAVTAGGTALEDGRTGGVMRVKTPTAGAPVTARVQGPGHVTITD